MRYRPEIDGLRAVAVVPVILFHVGFGRVSGGFVGVDVFFVISGFLITSILLAEHVEGRFSIRRFYERRCSRSGAVATEWRASSMRPVDRNRPVGKNHARRRLCRDGPGQGGNVSSARHSSSTTETEDGPAEVLRTTEKGAGGHARGMGRAPGAPAVVQPEAAVDLVPLLLAACGAHPPATSSSSPSARARRGCSPFSSASAVTIANRYWRSVSAPARTACHAVDSIAHPPKNPARRIRGGRPPDKLGVRVW